MRDPKGPVKPYRSPQEISKRTHVPLSKIMKQVKMGTKVEGEHTTSKSSARITALQHVDELPDYYTKLKKVEKKKSMEESLETAKMGLEGKRYCKLCRKSETQNECSYGPEMWTKFSIATVHPANEEVLGEKKGLWDNIHARRKAGKPPKKPGEKGYPKTLDIDEDLKQARKNVGASKCWPGKVAKGTKMKGGKEVPNCVPAEDTCMSFSQFMQLAEVAAWQRKEGKNQSGGLNEKGRKSYERENPGSDLKAPSKKVGNPRRASFCARMKGMKSKLTSSKTANDPNSRINKSLRAWNC